jgi:DNA-binding Lrp family transcriptional regulator
MIVDAINKPSIIRLDELDMEIVALLVSGKDNKQIANEVKVPLSTIQRRTRRLFEKNIVKSRIEPNYRQLGYNKGVVHLYINNVDTMAVSQKLAEIPGGGVSLNLHRQLRHCGRHCLQK